MGKASNQNLLGRRFKTRDTSVPSVETARSTMASGIEILALSTTFPSEEDSVDEATIELLEWQSLVLWRRPVDTLKYGTLETGQLLISFTAKLLSPWLMGIVLLLGMFCLLPGPHEDFVLFCQQRFGFAVYWLGLGVLSSVGFGTGLHTFLLYLGPHIAAVTLAAYECQTLDFPTPPYPDIKVCPQEPYRHHHPDVWEILSKVRPEALLWGIGTALGELPPYFMARRARLSNKELDGAEADKLLAAKLKSGDLDLLERTKLFMERVMRRVGFLGILFCASVPNPLFDLAGITCGHFLVPFWKFFLATLIGKALVKATIQQLFVIASLTEDLVHKFVDCLGQVPYLGPPLQQIIKDLLRSTKQQMHGTGKSDSLAYLGLLVRAFELCAFVMVACFVVSSLNCLAQIHCKRQQEKERKMRNVQMILYAGGGASSSEEFTV
ncbi:vacuole membrane protein 1 [Drosophila biarmipes]|uniref:vacuole membrane protein 1 n=1 Tax=Drosophila biarmipes TaxID=125945 RepID=UPI0021CCC203|nr:vacuole membrane protein 1 [Drosophila biarmipes]